jgi:putative colanic acid biosynthesis UDP-glucose lipid carrier transferase
MRYYSKSLKVFRLTADIISLAICFYFIVIIIRGHAIDTIRYNESVFYFILAVTWIFSSEQTHLYDDFRSRNFSNEIVLVIKNVLAQMLAAMVISFLIKEIKVNRSFVIIYGGLLLVVVVPQKLLFIRLLKYFRKKGRNLKKVLIIGAGEIGNSFNELISSSPHFGYKLVGFLDDLHQIEFNGNYLGKISDLDSVLEKYSIDDAIIALQSYSTNTIQKIIDTCEQHTTRVKVIPACFPFVSEKYQMTQFGRIPVISVRNEKIDEIYSRVVKRLFDLAFTAFITIFILWWLIPGIAIIIKLNSRGPAFFKIERWGRRNRRFPIYKFRTMYVGVPTRDEDGHHLQTQKDDPRITKIGKFLRCTNLDELPQFLNVFRGEMSVVGPRPHSTPLNNESRKEVKNYLMRHTIKPDMTGWAQVNGFRGATGQKGLMQKRVEFDLAYMENWSIWFDIQIIVLTVRRMFKGDPNAY